MAKKDWFDIASDLAGTFIPAVGIGKAAYNVGKNLLSDNDEDEEESIPSNIDLAFQAYDNEDYEEALKYLDAAHANDEIWLFHYYKLAGMCHYGMMLDYRKEYWEKAELLGLSDDTDDDDPRWEKLVPLNNSIEERRSLAYDCLKESLTHREEGDFIADKDNVAAVFWALTDVCTSRYEQRRYDMAAMASNGIKKDAREEYKAVTKRILDDMNVSFKEMKEMDEGDWGEEDISEEDKKFLYELALDGLFSGSVDYHERQFIYIAKNVDALAGCYDDNLQWLFTIDALPKELQFPVGHPQPNSLYYAHPAKKGVYLPIEGADEELFNDKVRDFQRLAQCLGATEITFRSVKGHSLSESLSKSMNVEVGGEYSGYEGSVNYDNKRSRSSNETMKGQREMVQRFNPNKAPYIPSDAAWLSVDPEWQSLVKQRLEGNMLHYSVRISSRKTMAVTESRMDDVKVAFKTFVANAHVNYSQQMERSFQREEETEWEISVTFKPLEEFDKVELNEKTLTVKAEESEKVAIKASLTKLQLTANEQEYLDNIREFLEDDAEITPRERKMLDRIRQSLGISEERAKELEASLTKPQLTEDEQEYLDNFREFMEDDTEITARERKMLDRIRQKLGISEERAKELEKMV